jgi:putative glutamine amidotransferase
LHPSQFLIIDNKKVFMVDMNRSNKSSMPIVGVPTCRQEIDGLDYDCTQHKYTAALYKSAKVLPLQIPLFGDQVEIDTILENVDGIMLTGSHSNIHPRHYENTNQEPDFKLDEKRDDTVLRLIKPAIEQGIPLLAICRGFQELNVAYGGSLYSRLHLEGSFNEHREDKNQDLEQRYDATHSVSLKTGGQLNRLMNSDSIDVNSLHEQGIKELGSGLIVEACSEDGLVEAVSVDGSTNFALGVQWHPEWRSTENPVSTILFSEFGKACYQRAGISRAVSGHTAGDERDL